MAYYDPQYYEYQALVFVARKFKTGMRINYKIPDYSLPWQSRNELDGLIERGYRQIAVEIKSFPLGNQEIREISDRLSYLGFNKQIIIAPDFLNVRKKVSATELLIFNPTVETINKFYETWKPIFNNDIKREIASGYHHFRYRLSKRGGENQHRYLNQVAKKINSIDKIKRELNRRVPRNNPPIKLLWSVSSFINPKDLFFRNRRVFQSNSHLWAFDIDGQKTHGAFMPCELDYETGLCQHCLYFSRLETKRLHVLLKQFGIKIVGTYFSGRSGFHTYCQVGGKFNQEKLKSDLFRLKVKNDNSVTFNPKSLIGFPESLNAISGYHLSEVVDLDSFFPLKKKEI